VDSGVTAAGVKAQSQSSERRRAQTARQIQRPALAYEVHARFATGHDFRRGVGFITGRGGMGEGAKLMLREA